MKVLSNFIRQNPANAANVHYYTACQKLTTKETNFAAKEIVSVQSDKKLKKTLVNIKKTTEAEKKKINKKMSPMLRDNEFLWMITSEKEKKKYQENIIHVSLIRNPQERIKSAKQTWKNIIKEIKNRILNEKAEIMIKETKESERNVICDGHITELKKLLNLLQLKAEQDNIYSEIEKKLLA